MNTKKERALRILKRHDQMQLLRFYEELSEAEQNGLLDEILQVDWAKVGRALRDGLSGTKAPQDVEPIDALDWEAFDSCERERLTGLGWEKLRAGKVGAVVVAGGQGSRLGHPGPKGTFDVGLPSGKSLFQLQAEKLIRLSRLAGHTIPWYIMTSADNHDDTVRFFENGRFFGYGRDDVFFFTQGSMPALNMEGKAMLSAKGRLHLAPGGNGDCFPALKRSGALADMKRRGVEWLFYYNVDNLLIQIADPRFVGVAAHYGRPIAVKAAEKSGPDEKVGILCRRGGRPAVVEYTDVSDELKHMKDERGRYVYGTGNISINLFRLDFIERYADCEVPYHVAHKKMPVLDDDGLPVVPESPNAYKLERFIFDFFPLADNVTIVTMKREEQFAPVKNREGEDSPATARQMLLALHRRWLLAAGVPAALLEGRDVEISPLDSFGGEGLGPDVAAKYLM